MSEIRRLVAKFLAEGLSLNEIAHRLGVARATVGYHVQALREARQAEIASTKRRTAPVAAPGVTRAQVQRLLDGGQTRAAVAQLLGVARSVVTYHAGNLGEDIDERFARRYDWQAIRRYYEEGHSVAECRNKFGFNRQSWHSAIRTRRRAGRSSIPEVKHRSAAPHAQPPCPSGAK